MIATRSIGFSAICLLWAGLLAGGLCEAAGRTADDGPADAVFVNGKVFTVNAHSSIAQGFAIKDGHFLAVGSSQAIRRYIGKNTKVVDLGGRMVVPGLCDGHFHDEGGGRGIVSNSDWHEAQLKEKRLPLATELDTVSPNTPVVLVRGGHSLILNSAALRTWRITKDTVPPQGGAIRKGPDGELTGEIFDNAKRLVDLPPPPPVTIDDVLATQRKLNAFGITSVRIPGGYKGQLLRDYQLLKQARNSGQLTLRYTVYLPGFGVRDPARIREMIANSGLKPDEGDEWVRIDGVKLGVDGGFEG